MCTWITEQAEIVGHGKGVSDWIALSKAIVYYDHPVSAPLDHAVIIDFVNPAEGPGARIAVELSPASARALLHAIEAALASGEGQQNPSPAEGGSGHPDG